MYKTVLRIGLLAGIALAVPSVVNAQSTTYHSATRGYLGSSFSNGGTTTYHSATRGYLGSSYSTPYGW